MAARPEAVRTLEAYCNNLGSDNNDLDKEAVVGRLRRDPVKEQVRKGSRGSVIM